MSNEPIQSGMVDGRGLEVARDLTPFEISELLRVGIDLREREAVEEHLDWMQERMRAPFGDLFDPRYLDALDAEAGRQK